MNQKNKWKKARKAIWILPELHTELTKISTDLSRKRDNKHVSFEETIQELIKVYRRETP